MRLKIAAIICAAMLLFAGCTQEANETPNTVDDVTADVSGLTLSEEEFPRLDGSTSNIPLGEALAAFMLGKDRAECKGYAEFSGTNEAYKNLVDGGADLLLVYEIPDDAAKSIRANDIESASIGRDALVFIVNVQNPVDNLTTQQIIDIYSGKITNWQEVGGEDAEIAAFQRNDTSGSQTLMKKLVMNKTALMPARENFIAYSMSDILKALAFYDNGPNAIGYNVYYYITEMNNDPNLKILSVDGVYPANDTIASQEYPFVNDFYAVIRQNAAEDSPERLLFHWLQSYEGQALVYSQGYVSLEK